MRIVMSECGLQYPRPSTRPCASATSTASPGGSAATGGSSTSLAKTQGSWGRARARTRSIAPDYPALGMVDRVDAWYQVTARRPETPRWARRLLVTVAIVLRELGRDQVPGRAATR